MNYLEKEIDTTLAQQKIKNKKFSAHDLSALTSKITSLFFSSKAKNMDPYFLKDTKKKHDPEYWKTVDTLENFEKPILIVQDDHIHAWRLETTEDLRTLLFESTGFPFWITPENLSTLIYLDVHDCVHFAQRGP
ncbi:hypothetical protein [Pseudomonas sp. S11A4]|uniref:hypothetical protein n=1 Tax=Pseudomonas sp. S11A4 TaxID=1476791 RepID=UPI00215BCC4D|nr:hypothetical protein [Pseudomonas sp. S11A4]MCR8932920.1 hypothetical protein [Pseudomonas sp. S11A4]